MNIYEDLIYRLEFINPIYSLHTYQKCGGPFTNHGQVKINAVQTPNVKTNFALCSSKQLLRMHLLSVLSTRS